MNYKIIIIRNFKANGGPGINVQLDKSHVVPYNRLTGETIESYLKDIFHRRPEPKREVKMYTNEAGMKEFSKAIERYVKEGQFNWVDSVRKDMWPSKEYYQNKTTGVNEMRNKATC